MPHASRTASVVALLLLALVAPSGCGAPDEETPKPAPVFPSERRDRAADMSQQVAALEQELNPALLLRLLAAPHESARARLGPHRLRYEARFQSTPEEVPELPEVDAGAPAAVEVTDVLELLWVSAPGEPARFHLFQGDKEGIGRDLLVDDDRVFTRLPYRGWSSRALEGGEAAHERWLDDAQRSAFDVVQFAAPRLALAVAEAGEDELQLTLSTAEQTRAELVASAPLQAWREDAIIDRVEGTLTLTRASGLWRRGELAVDYHHEDDAGRRVDGALRWSGELAPVAPEEARLTLPEDAAPTPDRLRYEVEKRQLLDGVRRP